MIHKKKSPNKVAAKTFRERLENNFLVVVIGACVATAAVVYAVMDYLNEQKIAITKQAEANKWQTKITELKNDIARSRRLAPNEDDDSINYSQYSIVDASHAPTESDRLYDGIVLVQPITDTRYFKPHRLESIFEVTDALGGGAASPFSESEGDAYFEKKYSTNTPMHFVWRGHTSYKISTIDGDSQAGQCQYKNAFHYFSVSNTKLKQGESYDVAIISKIQNRFSQVIEPEKTEIDQIFLGRQGRIFILELKFVCRDVRLNDDAAADNLYMQERQVIFPVRNGYVTVYEFVPSTDRIVSDQQVLSAENIWLDYLRVFRN